MRDYEKGKRTKKPFGQSLPHSSHVTHEEIKTRENKFNPILQTFKSKDDESKADSLQEFHRVKSLMNHIVSYSVTYRKMSISMKKTMTL